MATDRGVPITTKDLARLPLFKLIRPALRTKTSWRLTGISLVTSLLATKGHASFSLYEEECKNLALKLKKYARASDNILDFGCGIGATSFEVSQFCSKVHGLDVNKGYIKIANRLYATKTKKVEFLYYDGSSLPFREDSFDMVYSHAVFERIPKDVVKRYIKDFGYVLKSRGILWADFITRGASKTGYTDLLGPDAYIFWSKNEVENLLTRLGFKINKTEETPEKFIVVASNNKQ